MLKELLFQFIISLLPIFAFQLWHYKKRSWKGFKVFISVFSGIAMVICMLTASHLYIYEIDFRFVPYLIGSLYGGIPALTALTVIYVFLRIPSLDSIWEAASLFGFLLVVVVIIVFAIRPFQQSSMPRKKWSVSIIITIMMLLICISLHTYMSFMNIPMTLIPVMTFLFALITMLLSAWLSVFIIESLKEKQSLYEEVIRVSLNYSNEVEKMHQLIEVTPFAVLIIDVEGRITQVNEAAIKFLFIKPIYDDSSKLLNLQYTEVFQQGAGDEFVKLLHQALNDKNISLNPIMSERQILITTSVTLRDVPENFITGAAILAQDITEISNLRDEVGRMERLSLVGQMAASITHEIRNPMAVIRGFVQLIQERSPQIHQQYFRIIIDELDRTNMIISDFLSLAQNREVKMELTSLHDTINDLIPLLNADANLRGLVLHVEFCDNEPQLMLNAREIKQLLLNISRNGMEAMGEKGTLHIGTYCYEDRFELRITDEGIGIPEDKMNNLFEPFFTTKSQGTGLGLPLCLSIAERHNGSIDIFSEEGIGTTFIVSFYFKDRNV